MSFVGKKVLVTGASRGIGKKIFDLMGDEGAIVYGTSTKSQDKSNFFEVDFSDPTSCVSFYDAISDIEFDVCVNNAGINIVKPFDQITTDDYDKLMSVNVKAPFMINQIVTRGMRDRGCGRIINISSIYGLVSREGRTLYNMSKSCLLGMTKTLAIEMANTNVLVNSVSPGFTRTDLTEKVLGETGITEIENKIPVGRLATTEEIAKAVLFLCGEENTYITGQNIVIDGGYLCG